MQSAKEKVSNMATVAKEKIQIAKAKAEEQAEKATARTREERVIAEEREKMKEAEARLEMHGDKARHAAEKLDAKQHGVHGYHIPGTAHNAYGSTTTYDSHGRPIVGGTGAPVGTIPGTTTTTTTHHQHHNNPLGGFPANYNKHY